MAHFEERIKGVFRQNTKILSSCCSFTLVSRVGSAHRTNVRFSLWSLRLCGKKKLGTVRMPMLRIAYLLHPL